MAVQYFGDPSRRLFGAIEGEASQAQSGIVFCPPCAEEMITTYARLARWSKQLASAGIAVMRFHPFGTGESGGSFVDFNLEGAVQDTVTAIRELRQHMGKPKPVGVFGVRFGAFVAARAMLAASVDFMVLWAPIIKPRTYFRQLLLARLAAEAVHSETNRVTYTTQNMVDELRAGRPVDILGYEFSPVFHQQMTAGPSWPLLPECRKVLLLTCTSERTALEALPEQWTTGNIVDYQSVPDPPFWENFSSLFPHRFAAASERWLRNV